MRVPNIPAGACGVTQPVPLQQEFVAVQVGDFSRAKQAGSTRAR